MKGCKKDVRSTLSTLVSSGAAGKEGSWEFSPLLLMTNGAEIALGVFLQQQQKNKG